MKSDFFPMKGFNTVLAETTTELMIQKSRFITYLIPVFSEAAASSHLERIKKAHWDATHHVPAWILTDGSQKFSDDGEPGGTAGLPVLEALKHREMKNCMAVVVRYFGGVKLGTGGLVRAYGQAARTALDEASCFQVLEYAQIEAVMDYTHLGRIQAYLSQPGITGIDTAFTDTVNLQFFVETQDCERVKAEITDLTHGSAIIKSLGTEWLAVNGKQHIRYLEDVL